MFDLFSRTVTLFTFSYASQYPYNIMLWRCCIDVETTLYAYKAKIRQPEKFTKANKVQCFSYCM